jgi:uncharacterized metal-binding protein
MEDRMAGTIQVRLTDERCELGDAYAQAHKTTPPKTAVLSCEGMCLRGEIARRAANRITFELVPDRAVRVCHGGLLETGGGMRGLVERAEKVLVLDGCGMACGTRLFKGAYPDRHPTVAFTDSMFEFDRTLFGVNEMTEAEIQTHAGNVAVLVVAEKLDGKAS